MTAVVSAAFGVFILWIEYLEHRGARRAAVVSVALMLLACTWAALFTDFEASADYGILVGLFGAWGIAWLAWGRQRPSGRRDPAE